MKTSLYKLSYSYEKKFHNLGELFRSKTSFQNIKIKYNNKVIPIHLEGEMKNLKLSLKLPYEDKGIYFSLLEENVKVRIGCGYTIVYLNKFRTIANQIIWKIPREISSLADTSLYIEISESGGLSNNYSYSHIVCLGNGKKLKPYHIPGYKRPNGIHANFAIRSKVCTVECFDYKYIKITEFTGNMLLDSRICYVSEIVLFEGLQKDLPKELEKFSQAIIHAVIKANCPDCRHSHYFCD